MLTAKQEAKKAKVEAAGQVFLPPSQYREMMMNKAKPKYSKSAVKANPQQIASYSARKAYKKDFKEISPDTDLLIDQTLNPEDVNESIRWPNTYGLSATYKSKTILNAKFSADNRCCVAVNPTIRDSIFTTSGLVSSQLLNAYTSNGANNPYSIQTVQLLGMNNVVQWSAPIFLQNRQAIVPFPNAQTQQLLYPAQFSIGASTVNIWLSMRFPSAMSSQADVRLITYGSNFQVITDSGWNAVNNQGNPSGIGHDFTTNITPANADIIEYFAVQIRGTPIPYVGDVYAFFRHDDSANPNSANIIAPNHAQHVNVYDIRDADTILDSADQAFVLAQSLLITAQMSDLNNGGVIAIARVPGAAVIGEGDDEVDFSSWYDWIASLPYNSYDGAVKEGGYAWYLPEDETGFFYRPLDAYFGKELPYLVTEFTASDTTEAAIVRIKVATIVQFTTTSSVYDCRPSCHISEMAFMHHVLSLIQAAYPNGTHKEQLKRALKKVGGQVVKLLKNPKTYTTVAELLGGLSL